MLPNNRDQERPHGGMPDRQRPAREDLKRGIVHPQDAPWGTSRGGLSTTLHLRTDGGGRPLVILATPSQRHQVTQLQALLAPERSKAASRMDGLEGVGHASGPASWSGTRATALGGRGGWCAVVASPR
jgi:hypothetical protein